MNADTLLELARAHVDTAVPADVRPAFLDALESLADELDPAERLEVYVTAVGTCTFTGRPLYAQELARRGTALAEELGDTESVLSLLNFTGICSSLLGDVVGGIDAFSHLQREASETGNARYHMMGALNLGYMFAYLGNADNAERVFEDALRICRLYGSTRDEINAWVGLAQVNLDRHRHAAAVETIERARALIEEYGSAERRGIDLLTLHEAWVDATGGAPERAIQAATPLLDSPRLQLPQDALRVRYMLAHACAALEDWDAALEHANAGIGVGQQPLTESLMSHLMELRSTIHRARGDADAAWRDAHDAVRMARRSTFANVGAALRVSTEQYSNELRLREAELEVRNDRLASVVADLKQANRRLALEVDEHKKTQLDLSRTHGLLVEAARMAGMAEVSTGVVHDIGNAVNSLLVSTHVLSEALSNEAMPNRLARAAESLRERGADPAICKYLDALAAYAQKGLTDNRTEVERMQAGVQHIAKIVQVQQRTSKSRGIAEPTDPAQLVDDALQLALPTFDDSLQLDVHCPFGLTLTTARHRVVQILHNLIKNAHDALHSDPDAEWCIKVHVDQPDESTVRFIVEDSGPGIPQELRNSVFAHGFTTKRTGNGFGLHSSALGAVELGGRLILAPSEDGRGARFELCLPVYGRQGAVNTRLEGTSGA